jgi:hypothetical protein
LLVRALVEQREPLSRADAPYIKVMDLKLNVSTQGLATSEIATNNVCTAM